MVRLLLILLLAGSMLRAQPASTADIELGLRKLDEMGTVLMIGAHPDDERTNVLAYLARGRHMRTAYLSITRGEGGQNLIGPDQGDVLGVIRTQELLAARRIDGAEQFFTRAIDFGFSKTPAESLEKWGHEKVLSDVVWVVRRYRPDVIILCFSGTPSDGHGHHVASALLGKEAFEISGDPARFPEQLKYVQPWKAAKLVYAGGFGGGRGQQAGGRGAQTPNATPPPPPIAPPTPISTEGFSPYLGYSFDQLATISRSQHRSQGFGNTGNGGGGGRGPAPAARPGGRGGRGAAPATEAAATPAPPPPAPKELFEGIDHSWARLPGGAPAGALFSQAIREFDPSQPQKTIPLLARARPIVAAIDDPLAKIKLRELDELIGECAGLWADASATRAEVTPGSKERVTLTVYPRLPVDVKVESARVEGVWAGPVVTKFEPRNGGGVNATVDLEIPASEAYSQPYWLREPKTGDRYTVDDQMLAGLPDSPVEEVHFALAIAGTPVEVVRPIENRSTDRAEAERIRPITVVPPVSVNLTSSVAMFTSATPRQVQAIVRAEIADAEGDLRVSAPAGWKVEPRLAHFKMSTAGEERDLSFMVTPPSGDASGALKFTAALSGASKAAREIAVGMNTISYPHIPVEVLFPPSELKMVRADVHISARHVGYIMGAGDEVPDALRQMGLEVTMLDEPDLAKGNLARFDAIVAGVRAYNVRADLRANQSRLMDYVRNGGTYLVQYMSAGAQNIGPYKITIPGGNGYRVTVEDVPVKFTHPDSRLLQAPNHITETDFAGWVQERGLLFPTEWDPKYETVFSAGDPGEKPLEGGELWTHYGKGVYIFSSYVWFRELPAGVPGAYRLFANMLSAK